MGKRRSDEEIATQFVNLKNDLAVKNFREEYRQWLATSDQPSDPRLRRLKSDRPLKIWVHVKRHPELERFTADRASIMESALIQQIADWSEQLQGAWGDDPSTAENALAQMLESARAKELRQVKLGSAQIQPRDLFDKIAIAILKASERNLLRICKGHKQGWKCPTPYLVADEKRRVYCYMNCGDEAKSQAKLVWWKRNLSAGARKRSKEPTNK